MKSSLKKFFILLSFFLCLCSFSLSTLSYGMVIAPSKINLNVPVEGEYQDIQAIISGNLAGTLTGDFYISFSIEYPGNPGTFRCILENADALRYCYIDDNFLISFNRLSLQAEIETFFNEQGFECPMTSLVLVTGSYDYYYNNDSNDVRTGYLTATSYIDIIKPGNKK